MSTEVTEIVTGKETPARMRARILVVDTDRTFRETLARLLSADGHEVVVAETGRRAFALLRDRSRPIAWLYSRADLDSLIDGWILADEYHSIHPERPVFIAGSQASSSASGEIILKEPTPFMIADSVRRTLAAAQSQNVPTPREQRQAA
jgi:DNA-binding NtrC family response regulator